MNIWITCTVIGLAPIFLAAPTSTDDRLKRIAQASQGFVYAISRTGITGTQQTLATDARQLVNRLRRFTDLPIAVGFGISNAEHVAAVGEFADAAVIGSAIVALIEKSDARRCAELASRDFSRVCVNLWRWPVNSDFKIPGNLTPAQVCSHALDGRNTWTLQTGAKR